MFGQTALGSTNFNDAETRMFRFEVEGLRQTYQADKISYPIRRSGSFFTTVPYSRMNEEMQRISRLGGKIVSIQPLTLEGNSEAKMEATTAHQNLEAEGKSAATAAQQNVEAEGGTQSEATASDRAQV